MSRVVRSCKVMLYIVLWLYKSADFSVERGCSNRHNTISKSTTSAVPRFRDGPLHPVLSLVLFMQFLLYFLIYKIFNLLVFFHFFTAFSGDSYRM